MYFLFEGSLAEITQLIYSLQCTKTIVHKANGHPLKYTVSVPQQASSDEVQIIRQLHFSQDQSVNFVSLRSKRMQ